MYFNTESRSERKHSHVLWTSLRNVCVHSRCVLFDSCSMHDNVKLHIVKTTITILSQTMKQIKAVIIVFGIDIFKLLVRLGK